MNNYYQAGYDYVKKAKEINLRELYKVMKRRFWVILLVTILAGAVGVYKSTVPVTNLYQASSRVIINTDDQTRTTLQVIIQDSTVLDRVIKQLNLPTTSAALANDITVASIDSSQVVSITVVYPNPILAAQIADTTAQVFKEEVPKIVGKDNVQLLSMAKVDAVPINSSNNNRILIYTIAGLVLGIGLAFLIDSLDDSIRSEKEAERLLGIPVLGRVSKVNKKNVQRSKKNFELEFRGETIGSK